MNIILSSISPRENQILRMIAHEYTAEEIATTLYLSPHTVNSHRKNLLNKMQVKNTAGLVRRAFELGILTVVHPASGQGREAKILKFA